MWRLCLDLAAAEAEDIAELLQQSLFVPLIEQWHPGQPVLAKFVMRRPDSDNAAASVQNIAALSAAGLRVEPYSEHRSCSRKEKSGTPQGYRTE